MEQFHLDDAIFLHLRLNHLPIVLGLVGTLAVLLAAISRKDGAWRYGAITLLLAGISAYPAYWTGDRAWDLLSEQTEGVDYHGASAADHEASAVWALIGLLVAGAAAAFALVKPGKVSRTILLVTALAATAATAWTASIAGNIVHGPGAKAARY